MLTTLGCIGGDEFPQVEPLVLDDGPSTAPLIVQLEPEVEPHDAGWRKEYLGLIVAICELGLTDLTAVTPRVGDRPVSPGLAPVLDSVPVWRLQIRVGGVGERFEVQAELYAPDGVVTTTKKTGGRTPPTAIAGSILELVAQLLGRVPSEADLERWRAPLSRDDYAVTIAGRAAAVWYGLQAPPKAKEGDRRRDPISRAVFLDPKMALAQWIYGRRHFELGQALEARIRFQLASNIQPQRALFLADEAAALGILRQPELAWRGWQAVATLVGSDIRFVLPRAQAALRQDLPEVATRLVDQIPAELRVGRTVAELRVAIADALGRTAEIDELLSAWQAADAAVAEPVRRRIALRVSRGDYADALGLVPDLEARGLETEARALAMSLELGLGRFASARAAALRLGDPVSAERIGWRARLEQSLTASISAELAVAEDPAAAAVRGQAALARGELALALAEAKRLSLAASWRAEALVLELLARRGLEDRLGAAEAHRALWRVSPADARRFGPPPPPRPKPRPQSGGGPRTAPGSTDAGLQSQPAAP